MATLLELADEALDLARRAYDRHRSDETDNTVKAILDLARRLATEELRLARELPVRRVPCDSLAHPYHQIRLADKRIAARWLDGTPAVLHIQDVDGTFVGWNGTCMPLERA